jgi:hypothetical protein
MKKFVELVDSNAQIAAYKKHLGLTKDQVHGHLRSIVFYRNVIRLSDEIRLLFKDKVGNIEKIKELRRELKDVFKGWKGV